MQVFSEFMAMRAIGITTLTPMCVVGKVPGDLIPNPKKILS